MALFNITHERYYNNSASFTGNGTDTEFEILESQLKPRPTAKASLDVFVNGEEISVENYTYNESQTPYKIVFTGNTNNTDVLEADGAPKNGLLITAVQINAEDKLGNYQYIKLKDIVNNFIVAYVGEEKIIPKVGLKKQAKSRTKTRDKTWAYKNMPLITTTFSIRKKQKYWTKKSTGRKGRFWKLST